VPLSGMSEEYFENTPQTNLNPEDNFCYQIDTVFCLPNRFIVLSWRRDKGVVPQAWRGLGEKPACRFKLF